METWCVDKLLTHCKICAAALIIQHEGNRRSLWSFKQKQTRQKHTQTQHRGSVMGGFASCINTTSIISQSLTSGCRGLCCRGGGRPADFAGGLKATGLGCAHGCVCAVRLWRVSKTLWQRLQLIDSAPPDPLGLLQVRRSGTGCFVGSPTQQQKKNKMKNKKKERGGWGREKDGALQKPRFC